MVEGGVRIKPWELFAPQSCAKLRKEVQACVPLIDQAMTVSCPGTHSRGVTSGEQLPLAEGDDSRAGLGPISGQHFLPRWMNVLVLKEEPCGTAGHPL